ncbi:MAG: tRNA glutamyl-Q(34) synthetase GluQRS, partial [Alphaproteobacteria bacterium]|nr:tRNA glutamyl-Q(34) synthetase GluQRS [Alphaproteobacteria bacterium]
MFETPARSDAAITRFAPSPTGLLHLGHAVAAIVAHDLARRTDGRFHLRIDDIDAARCHREFEEAIYEDLQWLGLNWDQAVRRQSDCLAEYETALDLLRARGLIYPCFCTRREIRAEILRSQHAPHGAEGPAYPGTCRRLSADERHARQQKGVAALRFDSARALAAAGAVPVFHESGEGPEGARGEVAVDPELLGDVVLARAGPDGVSGISYHLAVVIDDAAQNVRCVSRGRDLYFATHVQRLLQTVLELPAPQYLHHALALDATGKRLAKRHDALSLRHLRERGMAPDQVREMAQKIIG